MQSVLLSESVTGVDIAPALTPHSLAEVLGVQGKAAQKIPAHWLRDWRGSSCKLQALF